MMNKLHEIAGGVRGFFLKHIDNIKDNYMAVRENTESAEVTSCYFQMVKSVVILVAVLAVSFFLLRFIVSIALSVIGFFTVHKHLGIVVGGVVSIYLLAIIINYFLKSPTIKTENQINAEWNNLARDLLVPIQKVATKHGLEQANTIDDISYFNLSPIEEVSGVDMYVFCVEKDRESEKEFNARSFKGSLTRRVQRLERRFLISTDTPYGSKANEAGEVPSIYIYDVEEFPDYIKIKATRMTEEAYSLYKRENNSDDTAAPVDADF